ncbi:hypothetical protein LY474_40070 [Myxococcus stipitatus]|uniref:lipase family protein n=1 Tax=Myxococcus stipitatus TaxID=83455 RepID=UPI001F3C8580|nr:hypothetical protein [Myxococcus stipitatus]MCE9674007.1 hypothetical protein [Myxococcus stipitatus]
MFNPLSIQKQVFALSWLASQATVGNLIGPWNANDLQGQINNLNAPYSKWKVVWGPSYTLDDLPIPQVSNGMFVAQQLDGGNNPLPVYVVAVAGTNALSSYDMNTEDLDVDPTNWQLKAGTNTSSPMQVTDGDWEGLMRLLFKMQWPSNDIRTFLGSIPNKQAATLWFTGHSLGGALSPMLMLALMDPDSALNTQDTNLSHWQHVNLLATAGPSIGNQAFLDHFKSVFGAGKANATFIWNAKDVVPHAWNAATMNALTNPTNLYGLNVLPDDPVGKMIGARQAIAANHQYVLFEQTPAFDGPLAPYTDSKNTGVAWTADSSFMAQLGYQHLNAYVSAFGGDTEWFPQGQPPAGCRWFPLSNPCDDPKSAQQLVDALSGS